MTPRLAIGGALVAAVFSAAATGCKKASSQIAAGSAAPLGALPAGSAKPPVDHLAPGEIQEGTDSVYGLVLPSGMKVIARFPGVAHAVGALTPESVANYLRTRVLVSHVELGAVETVFPDGVVKGGDPRTRLRIEVIPIANRTKLIIRDVSLPAAPAIEEPGLSDAEKWRRAGYNPDGTPLDPNKLK